MIKNEAAQFAACSADYAAATAHVVDHARHAVHAIKAFTAADMIGNVITAERDWQEQQLPQHLH